MNKTLISGNGTIVLNLANNLQMLLFSEIAKTPRDSKNIHKNLIYNWFKRLF